MRALHPREERLYTFWDYTAGCWQRDAGFRIDHLLCSPEAADRLHGRRRRQMGAGEEKASDHAPTWVELAWFPGEGRGAGRRQRKSGSMNH